MRQTALAQAKNGALRGMPALSLGAHALGVMECAGWGAARTSRPPPLLPPLPAAACRRRCRQAASNQHPPPLPAGPPSAAFELLSRMPKHGLGSKLSRTSWSDDCFWTVQKVRLSPVRPCLALFLLQRLLLLLIYCCGCLCIGCSRCCCQVVPCALASAAVQRGMASGRTPRARGRVFAEASVACLPPAHPPSHPLLATRRTASMAWRGAC